MWSSRWTSTVVSAIALTIAVASAASVQAQRGRASGPQMRMYDAATEVALQGTVTAVKNITPATGGRGMQGMHIVVSTGTDTIEVHLGPSWYLKEQKIDVVAGDIVTVLGSRVTIQGAEAVIARRVDKGGVTWTLRDEGGRPLWAGRGRGPRS